MQLTAEQTRVVQQVASELIARGVPKGDAVRAAVYAAGRVLMKRSAGLGAPAEPTLILNAEEGPNGIIAEVKATVSPWLWVLSVVSFGMALVNARKISKMFGDWKSRRKPA